MQGIPLPSGVDEFATGKNRKQVPGNYIAFVTVACLVSLLFLVGAVLCCKYPWWDRKRYPAELSHPIQSATVRVPDYFRKNPKKEVSQGIAKAADPDSEDGSTWIKAPLPPKQDTVDEAPYNPMASSKAADASGAAVRVEPSNSTDQKDVPPKAEA
jgi:hypothetical protein